MVFFWDYVPFEHVRHHSYQVRDHTSVKNKAAPSSDQVPHQSSFRWSSTVSPSDAACSCYLEDPKI